MRIGKERCEYNSTLKVLSIQPPRLTDCKRYATWSIGEGGEWHICSECARRPEFRKYTVRSKLNDN